MSPALLDPIATYYSEKISAHGVNPLGVDWNGETGQKARFSQLALLITEPTGFSINDYGCGYGALLDFLLARYPTVDYLGLDVAPAMVEAAKSRFLDHPSARFEVGSSADRIADYGVASGIFNIRLGIDPGVWLGHLMRVLDEMNQQSRRGFAFNCLSLYSDPQKQQSHLYYADPLVLFDYCKRRFSERVSLIHDYGLYDFTLLVRKSL